MKTEIEARGYIPLDMVIHHAIYFTLSRHNLDLYHQLTPYLEELEKHIAREVQNFVLDKMRISSAKDIALNLDEI